MSPISVRPASAEEQRHSQAWERWESGAIEHFEYHYERDVRFVVQQGQALIHCAGHPPVAIAAGSLVSIARGTHGVWAISAAIVNRYQYL
ncbi:hypothetical protein ACIP1T_22560 [Pseudomonas japonica]|uniref:hypothetical protein n=1 Tax=Pseudomonas japonica TaxID=256466 RepID=UPI003824914F